MPKLFSYVVEHDHGYALCPSGGLCTLAKCKYGWGRFKNVIELAEIGDWIAGTGGAKPEVSAGHGKLIYAMRVDEKISLQKYCRQNRDSRIDSDPDDFDLPLKGRSALMSYHFFYFGKNAIRISEIPRKHLHHRFEKRGPGFRCDFSENFVEEFAKWMKDNFKVGVHGPPCKPHSELKLPKCPAKVRRRGCLA